MIYCVQYYDIITGEIFIQRFDFNVEYSQFSTFVESIINDPDLALYSIYKRS